MSEKIFLSYARQDRRLVAAVRRALRNQGIIEGNDEVIVGPQQSLKPGISNVRKTIKNQISSASKVVIIASDHSANSVWVNYEAGMAAALGKPIVLVRKKGGGKSLATFKALAQETIELEEKSVGLSAKRGGGRKTKGGERREPLKSLA